MEHSEITQKIEDLMHELSQVMKEFKESLDRDEIFEVTRKLKYRMNELEAQLEKLRGRVNRHE